MSCSAAVRVRVLVVAGLCSAGALGFQRPAETASPPSASPVLAKYLEQPESPKPYRALRRLEAAGRGDQAWLEAETAFSPTSGLHYEVTAEGGSGFIRSRVLRKLLEEERKLIASGAVASMALSPANYRFTPRDVGPDGLLHVVIEPRRRERSLIDGEMFLKPENGELVRVEGQLARNPSFWITRVDVVRTYRRINGVLMPVALESTAQLRMFGKSSLSMTYHYSHVDERPVSQQAP